MTKKGALPKVNSLDNPKKPHTRKDKPGSSKRISSDATRKKNKMKGGHVTDSGHTIGLTTDEQQNYAKLLQNAVQDILTESAFTPKQKAALIKKMPGMSNKDRNFYDFLNSTYKSGPDIAEHIATMERKETHNSLGRRKAIRTNRNMEHAKLMDEGL